MLFVDHRSQVYPTADAVVVLDASSLTLVRVLALREVFPDSQHVNVAISCLAVDPALTIVRYLDILTRFPCSMTHLPVHRTPSR